MPRCFPILYREDLVYPRAKHLPYYIGRILCTPMQKRQKWQEELKTTRERTPVKNNTPEQPASLKRPASVRDRETDDSPNPKRNHCYLISKIYPKHNPNPNLERNHCYLISKVYPNPNPNLERNQCYLISRYTLTLILIWREITVTWCPRY